MVMSIDGLKETGSTLLVSGKNYYKWGCHFVSKQWKDTLIPIIKTISSESLRHLRTCRGLALGVGLLGLATFLVSKHYAKQKTSTQTGRNTFSMCVGLAACVSLGLIIFGGGDYWI